MLSILIPVYNFDIRDLVKDLNQQSILCEIEYEIVCFDDGSEEEFKTINRVISKMKHVNYVELKNNLGRSKIRNELAMRAKFDHLLFMDCDSKVVTKKYIQNYISALQSPLNFGERTTNNNLKERLIYGGRSYAPNAPKNPKHLFHWTFGIKREQSTSTERSKQPYHSFMTNNFLIPKKVLLAIKFDESLTQYGHEDTLFGLELKSRGIPILHIDNPLEHIGLENAELFISKSKKAIQNLLKLIQSGKKIETRLLLAFRKIQKIGMVGLFGRLFQIGKQFLEYNLKSSKPMLKVFDIYKLGYLCWLVSNQKKK